MGVSYNSRVVTDGLVLCLDAANGKSYPGAGTTWVDLSDNGNNGTLINGVSYNDNNVKSLSFDGSNDYVNIPNFSALALSTACTISIWSYVKQNKGYHFWGNIIFLVQIQSTQTYRLRFNLDNDWRSTYTTNFPLNAWHKLDITWDGTNTKMYINSQQTVNSTSDSIYNAFSNATNRALEISKRNTDCSNVDISQILIHNQALTASEIQQNFNATRARYGL